MTLPTDLDDTALDAVTGAAATGQNPARHARTGTGTSYEPITVERGLRENGVWKAPAGLEASNVVFEPNDEP